MSFETLGLGPNLLRAIIESGYENPTPIQASAIPLILEGRDLTGIAQTGTGKTAAFTLPMLEKLDDRAKQSGRTGTRALVLSPTRELVVQIGENVSTYSKYVKLRVAQVYGGVGEGPQKQALRRGDELVIATPGRLMDLMDQGCVDFSGLEYLVLDEADRMLDMGFLPNIRKIVQAIPKNRQTLLFSATLSKEIEKLTHQFQKNSKVVEIGRRTNPADTVKQYAYQVEKPQKIHLIQHIIKDAELSMVLVFSRTKHGADRIARQLSRKGITTGAIHSNRSQGQRARALGDFKSGKIRVLVATDIAARGIDVEGISHVINYDFPPHAEDYVHRIGRTGRAQSTGVAINFITSEDRSALAAVERLSKKEMERLSTEGISLPDVPVQTNNPSKQNSGGFNRRKGGGFQGNSGHSNRSRRNHNPGHRSGGARGR
jgi:ATP-dependent RNA helicase RhlE